MKKNVIRKMKKVSVLWALLVTTVLVFSGCGAMATSSSDQTASIEAATTDMAASGNTGIVAPAADGAQTTTAMAETSANSVGIVDQTKVATTGQDTTVTDSAAAEAITESNLQSRKLIKTVNMTVQTEDFDNLLVTVNNKIKALGGYVENVTTDNSVKENRYSNLTIRIPEDQLDAFVANVSSETNVIYRNDYVQDVTLTYVDMESHKKVLETEQETLLKLMEQATNIEDIITIEGRLSDVRYQIESMESQLRTYDNQINYSTVYLYITEVARITPIAEQDTLSKIKVGFINSYYNVIDGLKSFGVNFIINIPYIIVWIVIIGLILLVILILRRAMRKREIKAVMKLEKARQLAESLKK